MPWWRMMFRRWQRCRSCLPKAALRFHKNIRITTRAVRHLFRCAAGMDSLVIGEGQILSQVKVAYLTVVRVGTTGTISNMLFQRVLAIGKKIRTQTSIADNPVSVSYAAVKLT